MNKLKTVEELREIMKAGKKGGITYAFANGCFDLIHVGHIRYLEGAASEADCLIVAINGDDSVRKLKGPGRPLMPERERAEIISALSSVGHVLIFGDSDVNRLLRELLPDVHCKGSDYSVETVPERETALELGIRIAITGDPKDHSTTEFIGKLGK